MTRFHVKQVAARSYCATLMRAGLKIFRALLAEASLSNQSQHRPISVSKHGQLWVYMRLD